MRRTSAKLLGLGMVLALTLGIAGIGAGDDSGDQLCIPLGEIELAAPEGVESKRAPVAFPHGTHFTYSCDTCHHKWTGTDQFLDCTASGCHDVTAAPKKGEKADPAQRYYKNAFHASCIGCHKRIKAKNEKLAASGAILKDKLPPTGPTGCIQCHPKDE